MVPAVLRGEITHARRISAQSEQLRERYSKFSWFLKIVCLRYEGPWGQDCVSGVRPCLAHSQNLLELIVHFDGGQNPYWTAVRSPRAFFPLGPSVRRSSVHSARWRRSVPSIIIASRRDPIIGNGSIRQKDASTSCAAAAATYVSLPSLEETCVILIGNCNARAHFGWYVEA